MNNCATVRHRERETPNRIIPNKQIEIIRAGLGLTEVAHFVHSLIRGDIPQQGPEVCCLVAHPSWEVLGCMR
jgi:hypothetical protein